MPQVTAKGYLKLPFTIVYDSNDVSKDEMLKRLLHVIVNPEGQQAVKNEWELVVEEMTVAPLADLFKAALESVKVNPAWFVRDPTPGEYCPACGKPFFSATVGNAVLMPHWYKDNKGYYVCTQCASVIGNEHDDKDMPGWFRERPQEGENCPECDHALVLPSGEKLYVIGEEGDVYCLTCDENIGDLSQGEHWPE